MNKPFNRHTKLISIQGDCVSCTTYGSTTLRILGGSADYSTPEILIDETFAIYIVKGEQRVMPRSGWLFRLILSLNPVCHVELIFDGTPRQSTLEECRELIFKAMQLDPEHYESSWSMEEWRQLLWSAETFEELYLEKQGGESYQRFVALKAEQGGKQKGVLAQ